MISQQFENTQPGPWVEMYSLVKRRGKQLATGKAQRKLNTFSLWSASQEKTHVHVQKKEAQRMLKKLHIELSLLLSCHTSRTVFENIVPKALLAQKLIALVVLTSIKSPKHF